MKKLFKILSLVISVFPFFLIGIFNEVRTSISDYANACNPFVFCYFISISSVIYFLIAYTSERKYYYINAFFLIFVAVFEHESNPFWHYFGAIGFFIGNGILQVVYTLKKDKIKILIAYIFGVVLLIMGKFTKDTLFFWAEVYLVLLSGVLSNLEQRDIIE